MQPRDRLVEHNAMFLPVYVYKADGTRSKFLVRDSGTRTWAENLGLTLETQLNNSAT